MISRTRGVDGGNLTVRVEFAPAASHQLESDGFAHLPAVLNEQEIAELHAAMTDLFASVDPDGPFRYAALNHSAVAQRAVAHPKILEVIEPLLGEDCHVIANTAWRNPPVTDHEQTAAGVGWHIDAGPHLPRDPDVPWDPRIPYPIFAIGCHLLLEDCPPDCGPTGFVPGSHRSGQVPPTPDADGMLRYEGRDPIVPIGKAGDAVLFVSDVWHRRMPVGAADTGRFFLQVHYGRRDIAQRLVPTADANQLSSAAVARAHTDRERTIVGLHRPSFYDG
ncbi:MAG: hypothetical protein HKN94_00320 [Acidimicrobiales bacterium]|nr:hypothetical protein [Acidimicrobiales bacterium]RZV43996.1 MAG: hypothetical protein EX269_12395 [Acidimicrobiales bacterium]